MTTPQEPTELERLFPEVLRIAQMADSQLSPEDYVLVHEAHAALRNHLEALTTPSEGEKM